MCENVQFIPLQFYGRTQLIKSYFTRFKFQFCVFYTKSGEIFLFLSIVKSYVRGDSKNLVNISVEVVDSGGSAPTPPASGGEFVNSF